MRAPTELQLSFIFGISCGRQLLRAHVVVMRKKALDATETGNNDERLRNLFSFLKYMNVGIYNRKRITIEGFKIQITVKKETVLANAFPVLGVKLKRALNALWSFFKVDLFSHINQKVVAEIF